MLKNEKMSRRVLPRGVVRICAGIVEGVESGDIKSEAYTQAVAQAGQAVGQGYSPEAEELRCRLLTAIKLNLVNRKAYSISLLHGCLGFVEDERQFMAERNQFCAALAEQIGL